MPVRQGNLSKHFVQENGVRRNARLDFGTTPGNWILQPPPGTVYYVERVLILIRDSAQIVVGGYGALPALTNGCSLMQYADNTFVQDFTDGSMVVSHEDWGRYCFDVTPTGFGAGDNFVKVRWSFNKERSRIRLRGSLNERLVLGLNDNLTGLVGHFFVGKGYQGGEGFI